MNWSIAVLGGLPQALCIPGVVEVRNLYWHWGKSRQIWPRSGPDLAYIWQHLGWIGGIFDSLRFASSSPSSSPTPSSSGSEDFDWNLGKQTLGEFQAVFRLTWGWILGGSCPTTLRILDFPSKMQVIHGPDIFHTQTQPRFGLYLAAFRPNLAGLDILPRFDWMWSGIILSYEDTEIES